MPFKANKPKKMKVRELDRNNPTDARTIQAIETTRTGDMRPSAEFRCVENKTYYVKDEEVPTTASAAAVAKLNPSIDYVIDSVASWQWAEIDEIALPVIIRDGVQYAAVLMTQVKLFSKFTDGISQKIMSDSKYAMDIVLMTEQEACLFNCVNACSRKFEHGFHFYAENDEIVPLEDVVRFYFHVKNDFLVSVCNQTKKETQKNTQNCSIAVAIDNRCKRLLAANKRDIDSNNDFFKRLAQDLQTGHDHKDLVPPSYRTGVLIPPLHPEGPQQLLEGWQRLRDAYSGQLDNYRSALEPSVFEHATAEFCVLESIQRAILKRTVMQRAATALNYQTPYSNELKCLYDKLQKTFETSSTTWSSSNISSKGVNRETQ